MTPAEDLLYANNFEEKFQGGIAQPCRVRVVQKPIQHWPRLNPVAVSCMQYSPDGEGSAASDPSVDVAHKYD